MREMKMMMQIQCLKGYCTGCEPAGDHHDEMGGVISIRGSFCLEAFSSIYTIDSIKTFRLM